MRKSNLLKFISTFAISIFSGSVFAIPTIGVPNITITDGTILPSFISPTSGNLSDSATQNIVQQQIENFSAQIRGTIIQEGQFKVVDVDNSTAQNYINIAQAQNNESSESMVKLDESSSTPFAMPKVTKANSTKTPEYLLIGNLSAINAGEEINQIINTTKYSDIYSIDLAVDYKLIRTNDKTIVASFTATGHSGDVKLLNSPDQKMQHNIPSLIQQVGSDLANQVNTQLNNQIGNGKLYLDNSESTPQITDFKTYKD